MTSDRGWRRARLHLLLSCAAAVALIATLFLPQNAFAAPAASPAAGTARGVATSVAEATAYVWQQTNRVRFDAGLKGLARDSRLDKVAQAWAQQQWRNGKMSHNPNYAAQIPAGWARAGENVASGYGFTQVVPAWVGSPTHYANLVRDYTSIGIGFYEADGRRYWTQVFAKYPGTRQPTRPTPPARPIAPTEPAALAGTPIALASPSFEGSWNGWNVSGARLDGPSTAARGGRYALAVAGSRTVSQIVAARPVAGSTYTATVWVRSGGASAVSGSLRLTALGGTTETATVGFTGSSVWMRVNVPLMVQRTGHTGLRVDVVLGAGDVRLDSASLVITQGPAAAPHAAAPPRAPSRH